jgi:hypothetical protein
MEAETTGAIFAKMHRENTWDKSNIEENRL